MSNARQWRCVAPLLLAILLAACSGGPSLPPLATNATVLAFGDSLTYGTGVPDEHSYPAVLAELTGWNVVRSGVPGEVSRDGLARLRGELVRVNPALVILCHGGNDVLRRMDPGATEANLRSMIDLVHSHGAEVVVIAVPKFGLIPSPPDFYDAIAEETGVAVEFDILADLLRDASMKSDQVHFNRRGYREMAVAVREMLARHGAFVGD